MTEGRDESVARHPSGLEPGTASRRRRRSRWVVFGTVIVTVALLSALFAFALGRDPQVVRSALLGKTAPPFELPVLSGTGSLRLSDLRGQVVVINFWASWCADCRVEHQALAAAWDRYRDQGVIVVGVDFQDSASAAKAFASELGMDWPLLTDPASKAALAYGVYGVPETFFIARDGTVGSRWVGPVSYQHLTDEVTRLQARAGE